MTITGHGFPEEIWEQAKIEATEILISRAKKGNTISYSELVDQLKTIDLEAHDTRLGTLLGEISTQEDNEGRGMLSVIVVHKTGDMQPGPGFFELASELGRDTSDIEESWIEELNSVFDYWSAEKKYKI